MIDDRQERMDLYTPVGPTSQYRSLKSLLLSLVQLGWIGLCLWGPIGPALLEDPVGRLEIACALLALLRCIQVLLSSGPLGANVGRVSSRFRIKVSKQ
jgi:hypothetical protein